MQADDLQNLARQFVDIKVPFADEEMKQTLTSEVKTKMDETIFTVLASYMDSGQLAEYNSILENPATTDEQILEFYKKNNIDLNIVMSEALTRFRIGYLGA